jgi:hypothetical protein
MNHSNMNKSVYPVFKFNKTEIRLIIRKYNNSSYFHVGPRYLLFKILSTLFELDKDNKITSKEDVIKSKYIMSKYNRSNYFHVCQRRYIFQRIEAYL